MQVFMLRGDSVEDDDSGNNDGGGDDDVLLKLWCY